MPTKKVRMSGLIRTNPLEKAVDTFYRGMLIACERQPAEFVTYSAYQCPGLYSWIIMNTIDEEKSRYALFWITPNAILHSRYYDEERRAWVEVNTNG